MVRTVASQTVVLGLNREVAQSLSAFSVCTDFLIDSSYNFASAARDWTRGSENI